MGFYFFSLAGLAAGGASAGRSLFSTFCFRAVEAADKVRAFQHV